MTVLQAYLNGRSEWTRKRCWGTLSVSRSQYLIVDKPTVDVLIQSLWRFNIWKSLVCFNVIVNTKVTLKHQWRIQRYMNLHVLWDYESSLKYFNWCNIIQIVVICSIRLYIPPILYNIYAYLWKHGHCHLLRYWSLI